MWRRLLVCSNSSIARLPEVLQVTFGWEDMHLNRFETRGREYGVYRDGGSSVLLTNMTSETAGYTTPASKPSCRPIP